MKKITLLFLSLAFSIASFAEIKMPKIFSDNMLLQRHAYVKIWGKADANAKVDVEFAGQQKSAKADAKGNWSLKLDKMPANKNPQEMKISENGKLCKTIKNILVGEVWVAGGQSNMEWPVRRTSDAKEAIARAKYPICAILLRMGTTQRRGISSKNNQQMEVGLLQIIMSVVGVAQVFTLPKS